MTATKKNIAPVAPATAFDNALAMLAKAGMIESEAGKLKTLAGEQDSSAQAMAIAAMTTPGILSLAFDYDVLDRKGEIVEHVKNARLSDYAHGFTKPDGKEYRAKATAFRNAILPRFFNIPGDNNSVYAMFRQTFPAALALIGENMTATIGEDGKLVLEGGEGDKAKAMREAATKSVTALKTAAKGGAAKREVSAPGEKESETRAATLTEILTIARNFLRDSIAGDEADFAPTDADEALIAEIAVLARGYGELINA